MVKICIIIMMMSCFVLENDQRSQESKANERYTSFELKGFDEAQQSISSPRLPWYLPTVPLLASQNHGGSVAEDVEEILETLPQYQCLTNGKTYTLSVFGNVLFTTPKWKKLWPSGNVLAIASDV